jgi:4-aminobutyrate aminotransferase-like enzyme
MGDVRKYMEDYNEFVAPSTIDHRFDIVVKAASGVHVTDIRNKEYLDFDSSVAVLPLGHSHPNIKEAFAEQQKKLDYVEASAFPYQFQISAGEKLHTISPKALAKKLIRLTFPDDPARVVFEVTGANAVNAAIKFLLTQRPERTTFISFYGAFHGRHGYALAHTKSKPIQRKNYPSQGISVIHFKLPQTDADLERIAQALKYESLENINAVLMEAIQGEGGIEAWSPHYWKKFKTLLAEHSIYTIADEIQSGLWRTGKTWAYQHIGMDPDIVITGKGLGSGIPISAVIYKRILEKKPLENGWHAGTFPASPAMVTAAIVTLHTIEHEKLPAHINAMSEYLEEKLNWITKKGFHESHSYILKGKGLMRGIEFRTSDDEPDPESRDKTLLMLLKKGIKTLPCGHAYVNPTIRLLPPYIIQKKHIDELNDALLDCF